MTETTSYLEGKRILAVDDETDILETIEEILQRANVDTAATYKQASEKMKQTPYDLAVLDIMGVDGMTLLIEATGRNIPAVMLTAHAVNPETLMESIRKGAIAYIPKEKLSRLDELADRILGAHTRGEPPWKLVFEQLGEYFNDRFGPGWKESNQEFWDRFERTYQVSKGIQERLSADERIRDKGV